jgi:hypothetical protein
MDGPPSQLRDEIGVRAEEIQSEEELDRVLGEIENAISEDLSSGALGDPLDELAAIDAWAALASYAVARYYGPASPWPRRIGGWSKGAARRLRGIAAKLRPPLQQAAQLTHASSWSIGVSFPWGIQISLTWP